MLARSPVDHSCRLRKANEWSLGSASYSLLILEAFPEASGKRQGIPSLTLSSAGKHGGPLSAGAKGEGAKLEEENDERRLLVAPGPVARVQRAMRRSMAPSGSPTMYAPRVRGPTVRAHGHVKGCPAYPFNLDAPNEGEGAMNHACIQSWRAQGGLC